MDLISAVLSTLLFAAFVPGVLVKLPPGGSPAVVLVTHAVLFAIVVSLVMGYYWGTIRGFVEKFGNYGPSCPNGYVPGVSQSGVPDCVPAGHPTYLGMAK